MNIAVDFDDGLIARVKELAAQSEDGRETGGILLGHGPEPGRCIHVAQAGDPGPRARRESHFFLRDLAHARFLAKSAWERSRAIWVGEWHTHLSGDPIPSPADLSTYTGLLQSAGLEFEVFLSLIATPDRDGGWEEPRLCPWLLAVSERALGLPEAPGRGKAP